MDRRFLQILGLLLAAPPAQSFAAQTPTPQSSAAQTSSAPRSSAPTSSAPTSSAPTSSAQTSTESPAQKRDAQDGRVCFQSQEYRAFHPIDEHGFYVRVGVSDLYRIEVEGSCPALLEPQAFLVTVVRGSNLICGPLDWDLRIAQPGPGGFQTPCIVKSQTHLTAQEAAAVPKAQRP